MQLWGRRGWGISVVVLVAALLATGCSDDADRDGRGGTGESASSTSEPFRPSITGEVGEPIASPILFSPEGNNLWAYDVLAADGEFESHRVNTKHDEDPDGWDINGQVCALPDGRIIAGEDTGQPDPPAGWGLFEVKGRAVGDLEIERTSRLVPTYAPDDDGPDTFGCGILSDGRVVTTVIGASAGGPANGQLILWYPPFDGESGDVPHCVLDPSIATAQQIWIDDDDDVYVASARSPTAGIWRYDDLPDAADADGGCGATSPGGSPMVDEVEGELVVEPSGDNFLVSPNGVVGTDDGRMFVSSVINGVIAEFTLEGDYVGKVLEPPAGEGLGADPFSTGTPLGLAVGPDGFLYYADLGLVLEPGELPGPAAGEGTVRRIDLGDESAEPETIADGLTFPDSLGFWTPE